MPGLLVLENIDGALFCEHCGSYVELPDAEPLRCSSCEASCSFAAQTAASRTSSSRRGPRRPPKWARGADDDEYDADAGPKKSTRATVEEECPECGHPVLEFYTMQMRSVDEARRMKPTDMTPSSPPGEST
ncbi:hypothetical protein JL720_2517 [Aureococcus anophagefferens]|nr:hypothetical protein JL720_2517 [Aureococcus anophagefferens]